MFLDRERREAFRDVYRFVRAADDVADAPGDPDEIIARLGAWRRELRAVYDGHAVHPYARRMTRVVRRYGLSRGHFEALLDGLEGDVRTAQLSSWPELRGYCEAVASSLAYLCLEILEVRGPAEERYARDVAVAVQLANILRDVAEDAARGHVYLPADELADAGVSRADVLARRMSPALAGVCRRQADRARQLIAGARAALPPGAGHRLLVPEIWADVYLALLDELERSAYDVFSHPPYLRRRRKLALALRRWSDEVPAARAARRLLG